jgi:hypothetical protein
MIFGYLFDDEVSFLTLMVLEDYNSLGMDLQILLCEVDFGDYLMVAMMSFILAKFVPTATSTIMVIRTLNSPVTY